jgi:hypothetical protein
MRALRKPDSHKRLIQGTPTPIAYMEQQVQQEFDKIKKSDVQMMK